MVQQTLAEADIGVTSKLTAFVVALKADDLPENVRHECTRAFVNAVGCLVGGARHALTETAVEALSEFAGPPVATICGRTRKVDILTAALLNGVSGAAYSFDDTYGAAMLHPGGPLVAALLALAERTPVSGNDFLAAYAAGLEIACRLTKALTAAPARGEMAWSQTGIVCGLAAALASGKLLGLTPQQLEWALGIAASEAAGSRAAHGSMAASLIFGHAAHTGLRAAILASRGFSASERPIEHHFGFARLFALQADLPVLVQGLGAEFELTLNTYKPFPCGLVIHPAIDAVLRLRKTHGFSAQAIARIVVDASPAAITFGSNPEPIDDLAAKVSLHHWVAVAAATGRAGIAEGRAEIVHRPDICAIRRRVELKEDGSLSNDAARVLIELEDGSTIEAAVDHCVGSLQRPMSDEELDAKCRQQAEMVIGPERAGELARLCWALGRLPDVGSMMQHTC